MAEENEEYVFQSIGDADQEEKSKVREVEEKISSEMRLIEVDLLESLGSIDKINLTLLIGEVILLTYGLLILLDLAPLF